MASLSRELRAALKNACSNARTVAEASAERSLRGLAVGDRKAHSSMSSAEETLRNRLRAHGRQLGDKQNAENKTQEIARLVSECAYEQWHRMLFARFLAENALLIEPESGVAISVDEAKELSRERGVDWIALAGEFAVRMLPQVFRLDDPVLEVPFAPEDRKQLEGLLQSLSPEIFRASDALGWCYQFWQVERKKKVDKARKKIGEEDLSAVTQLFTEDYMVDFLLDNTLGAWHASKVLAANCTLANSARDEAEIRQAVALPGCPWSYLRFSRIGENGPWAPAAGTFAGWPTTARQITCLDPCMGSGHFLVGMFDRLVALRMAEETVSQLAAVSAVIRENLFGLELDPRCTQIGAFNLALAAWRRVGHCSLPAMNLACSGLAPNSREAEWLALAGDDGRLRNGMKELYRLFQNAPTLGSLINPRAGEGNLLVAAFDELQPLLRGAFVQGVDDADARELAVTAHGLARAAEILAGQFTLVATNVPYLGRGKQDPILQDYCERVHPEAKADLATAFVERCLEFCDLGGSTALVTPQNWLFLGTYRHLRLRLLRSASWSFSVQLGSNAFQDMNWWAATTALLCQTASVALESQDVFGVDVTVLKDQQSKAALLRGESVDGVLSSLTFRRQSELRANPDSRMTFAKLDATRQLNRFAKANVGFQNGDTLRFLRRFWEISPHSNRHWRFIQTAPESSRLVTGLECCLSAAFERGEVSQGSWHNQSAESFDKAGVLVRNMGTLAATRYFGSYFDQSATAICCDIESLPALWAFVESPSFFDAVRSVEPKVNVTPATFGKVPVDLAYWKAVAMEKYPHGLPEPTSSDPKQWLFNGHPSGADEPLQVAVARLLGYQWPRQTGSSFPYCPTIRADGLDELADDDGIVPFSLGKGEGPAVERLRALLARAFGNEWSAAKEKQLLAQVGCAANSLDDWLRNKFFDQHCELFRSRPFIWHIWDGLTDGFHALVNYHQLCASDGGGRRALDKLTHTYIGDWIAEQRAAQKVGKEGADGRLTAALYLQAQLKAILDGEPPFDLFVRWKPLHEQAIGWEPDINDGVRMNIRPFLAAKTLGGKSIFRKLPKIPWKDCDRGDEPERDKQLFPWLWSRDGVKTDFLGGRVFDGKRWNDLHYSNAVKRAAREAAPRKRG
jgi:hypothetical protein